MESFHKISITLPREKMRDQMFYSTSKNWSKDHTVGFEFNKDDFLRELSCSTKNNKTVSHYDLRAQTIKLQHKLNQKNELLIKQSKWKNYYLKEQIYVLIQQILEYLKLLQEEIQQNSQFHKFSKQLLKIISKVQVKRKTQKNWIEFLGISQNQNFNSALEQKNVQTQEAINGKLLAQTHLQNLSNEINLLKEENKSLLKNLNIITHEIQNKQKEIITLQDKYSKLKSKREKMKFQYNQLKFQFQEFVTKKERKNKDLEKTQYFSKRKTHKNATHFHTYSWNSNQISQKSKFGILSQQNGYKIEQESSKFFILSDTPLIEQKNRQIPISTGFIKTRKKLDLNQKQVLQSRNKKSISNLTGKSAQKTVSLRENDRQYKVQVSKKSKTQNEKTDNEQIDEGELATHSLIQENEFEFNQMDFYRELLLSQAITIQNLLDKI